MVRREKTGNSETITVVWVHCHRLLKCNLDYEEYSAYNQLTNNLERKMMLSGLCESTTS